MRVIWIQMLIALGALLLCAGSVSSNASDAAESMAIVTPLANPEAMGMEMKEKEIPEAMGMEIKVKDTMNNDGMAPKKDGVEKVEMDKSLLADLPMKNDAKDQTEVKDKMAVVAAEAGKPALDSKAEKLTEMLAQPGMRRLARYLRNFHGRQIFRANAEAQRRNAAAYNSNDDDDVDDDEEAIAEERAIRRRKRIRRRNTKNKVKRRRNNKRVANRKKTSRRNLKNSKSSPMKRMSQRKYSGIYPPRRNSQRRVRSGSKSTARKGNKNRPNRKGSKQKNKNNKNNKNKNKKNKNKKQKNKNKDKNNKKKNKKQNRKPEDSVPERNDNKNRAPAEVDKKQQIAAESIF